MSEEEIVIKLVRSHKELCPVCKRYFFAYNYKRHTEGRPHKKHINKYLMGKEGKDMNNELTQDDF